MRQAPAGLLDDFRRRSYRNARASCRRCCTDPGRNTVPDRSAHHPAHFANRAVGAFERVGQHELGAERPQNQLALRARVFRQAQLDFVSARRADHRVGDAGVARRRIEDRQAGRQRARGFAVRESSAPPRDPSPIRQGSATRPSRRARRPGVSRSNCGSRTSGVRPIRSRTDDCRRAGAVDGDGKEDIVRYATAEVRIITNVPVAVILARVRMATSNDHKSSIYSSRIRTSCRAPGRLAVPPADVHSAARSSLALLLIPAPLTDARSTLDCRGSGCSSSRPAKLIRLWAVHHIGADFADAERSPGAAHRPRPIRAGPESALHRETSLLWVGFAVSARLLWLAPSRRGPAGVRVPRDRAVGGTPARIADRATPTRVPARACRDGSRLTSRGTRPASRITTPRSRGRETLYQRARNADRDCRRIRAAVRQSADSSRGRRISG